MDGLVHFTNVNDLPPVPEGARRSLTIIGSNWYYEDIFRLNFTDAYSRNPATDELDRKLRDLEARQEELKRRLRDRGYDY